jgi:DNA-3-methyladenine glycosylase
MAAQHRAHAGAALLDYFQDREKVKLERGFYDRDAVEVAKDLLGKHLVHVTGGIERVGRIVEVEAYLGPHDLAAHSARGLTPRTRVMFGPPGHAYVYLIYGVYHCMNVVTQGEGIASAVLLRALEPVRNVEARTQGPGLLCRAMHIDKTQNGHDLLSDDLYVAQPGEASRFTIVKRPRIGVDYAGHWAKRLLRFYVKGSAHVSKR